MSDGTNPAIDMHTRLGDYVSSPFDLDFDGENDIQGAATESNILNTLDYYVDNLNTGDNLFVFVTDHGDTTTINGENTLFIRGWSYTFLYCPQFYQKIKSLTTLGVNVNIVMGQCYSGGFVDYFSTRMNGNDHLVISSASAYNEISYANSQNTYDEYLYHWSAGIGKATPNGAIVNADTNNDGYISMSEAYIYANNHDMRPEHPQYYSYPTALGTKFTLYGIIPTMEGSNNICEEGTYTVTNVPDGSTITWTSSSSDLILTSQSGSSATFTQTSSTGYRVSTITATITRNSTSYSVSKIVNLMDIGQPVINYTPSGRWYVDSTRVFSVDNCPSASGNNLYWVIKKDGVVVSSGTGMTFSYAPHAKAKYTVRVTDSKNCTTHNYAENNYQTYYNFDIHPVLSPNRDFIEINIVTGEGEIGYSEVFTIELWDVNGNKLTHVNTSDNYILIPTTAIKTDLCILKVKIKETEIYSNIISTSR